MVPLSGVHAVVGTIVVDRTEGCRQSEDLLGVVRWGAHALRGLELLSDMMTSSSAHPQSGMHWVCQHCEFQYNMDHNITCCACDQPATRIDPRSTDTRSDAESRIDTTRDIPVPTEWTEVQCEDDLPATVEVAEDTETFDRLKRDLAAVGNVTSILRCEDYDLWESFVREKKKIVKKLNRRENFTSWCVGQHCYHSGAGEENASQDGSDHLHERLLFHTANATVGAIFEEGFDTRMSSPGNFGRGIYFSDDPKKCDWYWKGGVGARVMFVAQVILGDAKVYPRGQNDQRLTREPERNPHYTSRDQRSDRYDSVQGHITVADEFVIYQNARAFPMFAVHYEPLAPPRRVARATPVLGAPLPRGIPNREATATQVQARRAARQVADETEERDLEKALQLSLDSFNKQKRAVDSTDLQLAAALELSLASAHRKQQALADPTAFRPHKPVATLGDATVPSPSDRRQRCQAAADDRQYAEKIRSALVPGMWVRARRKAEGTINKGDVGTYVQTNAGSPPCQVRWRKYGATYWVQWADIEIVGWEEPSRLTDSPTVAASSTANSGASLFDITPEAAAELVALGFDEAAVLDALVKTAGDQEAAANLLLG